MEDSCLYCGNESLQKTVAFHREMKLQEMTGVLIVGINLHERHLPSLLECIFTEDSCIHWGNDSSFALTV